MVCSTRKTDGFNEEKLIGEGEYLQNNISMFLQC